MGEISWVRFILPTNHLLNQDMPSLKSSFEAATKIREFVVATNTQYCVE
jgi:hypothetical protein